MRRTLIIGIAVGLACVALFLAYRIAFVAPDHGVGDIETQTNSIGMSLVRIKPSTFVMGFDGSKNVESLTGYWLGYKLEYIQRQTTLTKAFWLGQYEVTHGQFQQFIDETGYQTDNEKSLRSVTWKSLGFPLESEQPVVGVTYNDALSFCDWLSEKENRRYRLPTESEWEYACRAGTNTIFSFGDDPIRLPWYGNILDQSLFGQPYSELKPDCAHQDYSKGNDGFPYLAPVGSFLPNRFGLYDMHGNAYEYCSDFYSDVPINENETVNPRGPSYGEHRLVRGGSWRDYEAYSTSFFRRIEPAFGNESSGFRVVLEEYPVNNLDSED